MRLSCTAWQSIALSGNTWSYFIMDGTSGQCGGDLTVTTQQRLILNVKDSSDNLCISGRMYSKWNTTEELLEAVRLAAENKEEYNP